MSKVVSKPAVLKRLGQLLKTYANSTSEVLPGVLGCLRHCTEDRVAAGVVCRMDALHILVQLLSNTDEGVQQRAAAVIANLCRRGTPSL